MCPDTSIYVCWFVQGENGIMRKKFHAQLKEIEDRILYLLSVSTGNILDDTELITTLANSKVTSVKIEQRVVDQEKTAAVVQQTRDSYVPVAVRSSAMFFVVADLKATSHFVKEIQHIDYGFLFH